MSADEFDDVVNMTPSELERWLDTDESKEVGWKDSGGQESVGHASGRRIVEIKRTRKADLTDEDRDHMAKVVVLRAPPPRAGGPEGRRGALQVALQPHELGPRPAQVTRADAVVQ